MIILRHFKEFQTKKKKENQENSRKYLVEMIINGFCINIDKYYLYSIRLFKNIKLKGIFSFI